MFADAPYAAAPFAALGVVNVVIDINLAEAASVSEVVSCVAAFVPVDNESVVGADTVLVSPSSFSAALTEVSATLEMLNARLIVAGAVAESGSGADSVLVAPSTFNATVSESSEALAVVLASASFIAAITEGAVAADQLIARLLWELIDDSQGGNWVTLNTASTPGWTVIFDEQTASWQVVNTQD